MTDLSTACNILKTLVGFDTTSRNSNLALIEWVEDYLSKLGIESSRVPNDDGRKANLYATVGPDAPGGVILSGHSDVVPVDGQDWTSDPWTLTERNDRLFGRGTCDMKGFIALALAFAPAFAQGKRPVHLAISYDEEIGCKGAPAMVAQLAERLPDAALAIVGEPSEMQIIDGHKGITVHEVVVAGHEAHSSQVQLGVSANMIAVELMHDLAELSRALWERADPDNGFEPPAATLTIGQMHGGTAPNILAREARFTFDLRCPPGDEPDAILAPFREKCETLDRQLRDAFPDCGVTLRRDSHSPPMTAEGSQEAVAFVRRLTGDNRPASKVAYAAEGGLFQRGGFPTVICGPGSIAQAHQPDEWIAREQLEKGVAFMARLAEELGQ